MISIIIPYRNRDTKRVEACLQSLQQQSNQHFEVIFIDYGSKTELAAQIKELVNLFSFAIYHYVFAEHRLWNKSRAINIGIKKAAYDYIFIADVDLIFHPELTAVLINKAGANSVSYFQVGILDQKESAKNLSFDQYKPKFITGDGATGMTLFPKNKAYEINGLDEFYHLWGSEDTDFHIRIVNNECELEFYQEQLLLLHVWHPTYRGKESDKLSEEIQLTGIVQLNYQHMMMAKKLQKTKVNENGWGKEILEEDFQKFQIAEIKLLTTEKNVINHWLGVDLLESKGFNEYVIVLPDYLNTWKYRIKKWLGKKVPDTYTLKEVNDLLCMQLIMRYRDLNYQYQIDADKKQLILSINVI